MFRHISRTEIQETLASRAPMILIEALPEKYYRDGHLPGAINLPHDQVRQLAAQTLPDKNALIVTYCANTPCQNSRIAAELLVSLGYTNVAEYVEGKQGWVEAGLTLEKTTVEQAA
jgi:rhodanese-related sulfurtransferase